MPSLGAVGLDFNLLSSRRGMKYADVAPGSEFLASDAAIIQICSRRYVCMCVFGFVLLSAECCTVSAYVNRSLSTIRKAK